MDELLTTDLKDKLYTIRDGSKTLKLIDEDTFSKAVADIDPDLIVRAAVDKWVQSRNDKKYVAKSIGAMYQAVIQEVNNIFDPLANKLSMELKIMNDGAQKEYDASIEPYKLDLERTIANANQNYLHQIEPLKGSVKSVSVQNCC